MTVFDDVLQTEQAALKSIEAARTEIAKAIADAKAEQQERIAIEKANLQAAEAEALAAFEVQVKTKTDAIAAEVNVHVSEVTNKFATAADTLKRELKQAFLQS
jgi:vacuolar-type H+-ATPase subunit H